MNAVVAGCSLERRREDVRQSSFLGLDFVELDATQTRLEVFFLGKAPQTITAANVSITGGAAVKVTGLRVYRQPDPTLDDWMEVSVDRPGDFSTYTLLLVKLDGSGKPLDGFDPLFASVAFSFKVSCPSDLDCRAAHVCPPALPTSIDIDYLAKDYASFRQLILDRLAQTLPGWTETHIPDVGVMLVELLAYVGDQLSYYQDAVATEAYLGTARKRISVRRHARLVDYRMHEGCNARAWVTISTDSDTTQDPGQIFFCTSFPGAPPGHILQPADFAKAPPGSCEVFEPLTQDAAPLALYRAHNEIQFYTWGDCACCLPKGATRATLLDAWLPGEGAPQRALNLNPGDVLIFEEVIGPHTGNPADADPTHRQAVCLTKVIPSADLLYDTDKAGRPVVEIEWCSEDALSFPLCISAVMPAPDCSCKEGISVARGNVVLVDSGATTSEALGVVSTQTSTANCPTDCTPATQVLTAGCFRPILQYSPLTFAQSLPACWCAGTVEDQDPRQGLPQISLMGRVMTADGPVDTQWAARADLLESGPDDFHFVVEVDDDGQAHLRFGNNDEGRMPDAGTQFAAHYRVGNGTDGNVGAESIVYLVFRQPTGNPGNLVPRNPLPALGGTAPEPTSEVRMFAPYAFKDTLERAITAADYATLAQDNARRLEERPELLQKPQPTSIPPVPTSDDPRASLEEEWEAQSDDLPPDICLVPFQPLQGAKAALRWNGSWYEAQVAIDPHGSETVTGELRAEVAAYLEPYRRVGHDLSVQAPDYVPLDVGLSICVKAEYERGRVEAALLAVLGSGFQPDGMPGLFNPDNQTFGQGVYASKIIAAAQAITGVVDVDLTRLTRYLPGTPPPGTTADDVPSNGVLSLRPFEIAQLDNDPSAPNHGRLTLLLRGGR